MVDRGVLDKNTSALFADPRIVSQIVFSGPSKPLPSHFKPGNWDVICYNGSGGNNQGHGMLLQNYTLFALVCAFFDILLNRIFLVGNQRFLLCIENHLKKYLKASSRSEKSAVISSIVTSIRESSTHKGGGFVRFDITLNRWYEVGDKVARDKVGQALRDAVKRFVQGKKRKENNKTTKKISNALPTSIGKVENKSCRFHPDEMYLNFRVDPKKSKRRSKLITTFKKSSVQRKQHNTKNPSVYDGALDSLNTMKTNELVPYLEVLYNL